MKKNQIWLIGLMALSACTFKNVVVKIYGGFPLPDGGAWSVLIDDHYVEILDENKGVNSQVESEIIALREKLIAYENANGCTFHEAVPTQSVSGEGSLSPAETSGAFGPMKVTAVVFNKLAPLKLSRGWQKMCETR